MKDKTSTLLTAAQQALNTALHKEKEAADKAAQAQAAETAKTQAQEAASGAEVAKQAAEEAVSKAQTQLGAANKALAEAQETAQEQQQKNR